MVLSFSRKYWRKSWNEKIQQELCSTFTHVDAGSHEFFNIKKKLNTSIKHCGRRNRSHQLKLVRAHILIKRLQKTRRFYPSEWNRAIRIFIKLLPFSSSSVFLSLFFIRFTIPFPDKCNRENRVKLNGISKWRHPCDHPSRYPAISLDLVNDRRSRRGEKSKGIINLFWELSMNAMVDYLWKFQSKDFDTRFAGEGGGCLEKWFVKLLVRRTRSLSRSAEFVKNFLGCLAKLKW